MRLQCKENFFLLRFFRRSGRIKRICFTERVKIREAVLLKIKRRAARGRREFFFGERRRIKFKFVNKVFQTFQRLSFKKRFFRCSYFAKKIFPRIFSKRKIFAQTVRCRTAEKLFCKKISAVIFIEKMRRR